MAPEEIPTVLRIVGLAGARPSPFDGQWLVEYDPTRPGTDPNGVPILAHLVTTPDRSKALRLGGLAAAHALWTKESGHTRPDGRRDRPLCAFDVVVERYHLPADEAAS